MSARFSPRHALNSTVGLKVAMAVTGLGMVGFVLQHMAGHLQVFQGQDAYNDYAAFMQGLGGIKWGARLGLLAILVIHVVAAVKLTTRNVAARPSRYETLKARASTWYGRNMILTGWVVLAFLLFHLAHFTGEVVAYEQLTDAMGRRDIYTNFVRSFQNPLITASYLLAVVAVSFHLAHAVGSMFRTLGLATGRFKAPLYKVGPAIGLVTGLGFAAVPLACLLGLVQ
ncbi:succinate dehydrogenase cytochrome b subunit [Paraliomyxa miuraensis]|uniref:succinate dehydrogenase cytochrome b subunit n=1 Tax=Paraliomyxa miuraensis TaxID=376150 RepID=UPI0022512BA5|nr:succinate dehydrogenase cytochrome b subunit [Paraliomyxa miuraensis]MCX4242209.1 succinate dehydrogenase cytochrome b subunit [Paraliomyxa miuraensis]